MLLTSRCHCQPRVGADRVDAAQLLNLFPLASVACGRPARPTYVHVLSVGVRVGVYSRDSWCKPTAGQARPVHMRTPALQRARDHCRVHNVQGTVNAAPVRHAVCARGAGERQRSACVWLIGSEIPLHHHKAALSRSQAKMRVRVSRNRKLSCECLHPA